MHIVWTGIHTDVRLYLWSQAQVSPLVDSLPHVFYLRKGLYFHLELVNLTRRSLSNPKFHLFLPGWHWDCMLAPPHLLFCLVWFFMWGLWIQLKFSMSAFCGLCHLSDPNLEFQFSVGSWHLFRFLLLPSHFFQNCSKHCLHALYPTIPCHETLKLTWS